MIAKGIIAVAVGVLLAAATPFVAAAAPQPPRATFIATASTVPSAGGAVTIGLRLHGATRCTFTSNPVVAKFRTTVRCPAKTIRRVLHVGANTASSARAITVTVTVGGPGGHSVRRVVVRQGAKGSTPSASGSTAPAAGGSSGSGSTAHGWWIPAIGSSWQWELDHPLNLASSTDMGVGDHTFAGTTAATPTVYDIDGFDNTAGVVAALHARGDRAICYIEVGAAERSRSDYGQFAAADLGSVVSGYPDERYLNIDDPAVTKVIEARIAMCATKGFDAIEPDIDDSYTESTGFSISENDDVRYDKALAAYAHTLGIGWGLKNGDGTDGFAAQMLPAVDFALDEQCFEYHSCGAFAPAFAQAGKAVFEAEYVDDGASSQSTYCPTAIADRFSATLYDVALDARVRTPCQ